MIQRREFIKLSCLGLFAPLLGLKTSDKPPAIPGTDIGPQKCGWSELHYPHDFSNGWCLNA